MSSMKGWPPAMQMGAKIAEAFYPAVQKAEIKVAGCNEDRMLFWAGFVSTVSGQMAARLSPEEAAALLAIATEASAGLDGARDPATITSVGLLLAQARSQ